MPHNLDTADTSASALLERVRLLSVSAKEHRDKEPLKAQLDCEEALQLLSEVDAPPCIKAEILLSSSVSSYRLGKHEFALPAAEEAKALFAAAGDKRGMAQTLSCLGNIYADLADYVAALKFHQDSLSEYIELDDKRGIAAAYNNLGIVYSNTKDFTDALAMFQKSLALRSDIGDKLGMAVASLNIGNTYSSISEPRRAIEFYEQSLQIFQSEQGAYGEAMSLANIGSVYVELGDDARAETYLRRSQIICDAIGNQQTFFFCCSQLGLIAMRGNRVAEAESCFLRAIDLCKEIGLLKEEQEARQHLAESYAMASQFHKAYAELAQAQRLKEQILNEEKQQQLSLLNVRYEVERTKKDAEIYRLRNIELAEANRSLEQANQFKLDLIGMVSHDLKNPLTSIMGFAELLNETLVLDDAETPDALRARIMQAQEMLKAVLKSSNFMLSLVKNLLDSTTIESGKFKLELAERNISELIDFVVQRHRALSAAKRQTILTDIAPNIFVRVDANRIVQVLNNLVDNAIKYAPVDTRIFVSAKTEGDAAEIRVQDEGQGFSEDDLKRVFGRFQRLSARPTGGESSTGLGLAIAKQLVELHHGKIWVESAGKGKGATFFIRLPLAKT